VLYEIIPVLKKAQKGVFRADPFMEGFIGSGSLQNFVQEFEQEGILCVHMGLFDVEVVHPDSR
jgi:hypothetical protein